MIRYFITGTDTDCGKTYATCQLINFFKEKNKKILAIKPVASGCIEQGDQLISEDVDRLNQQNGDVQLQICPWRFKRPISPHLAAEEVGQCLSAQAIADFCDDKAFADFEYLLIEGAGGLMVPLNRDETWLDFLAYSQMPVILVVGMRLGCLNHALLTEFCLRAHNIPCVGWIANCIDKNMLALQENIKTLAEKMRLPLLATIPFEGKLIVHQEKVLLKGLTKLPGSQVEI